MRHTAISFLILLTLGSAAAQNWEAPEPAQPLDYASLIEQFKSTDKKTAWDSFDILCEAGPGSLPALPPLLEMIESGTQSERVMALHLLVCIGEIAHEALPVLLRRAPQITDGEEMVPMMGALRLFGPEVRPLRNWLLEVLEGKTVRFSNYSSVIRRQAVEVLHLFDDPTLLPPMLEVLKDDEDDYHVRMQVVMILPDHLPESQRFIPYLIQGMFDDPKQSLNKKDIAVTLAKMGDYALPIFLERLRTDDGSDPNMKYALMAGLQEYVKEDEFQAMEGLIGQLPDPEFGYFARKHLIGLECIIVRRLIPYIYDSDPVIRHETLRVLSSIGPAANEAAGELAALLTTTQDHEERKQAAMALRMIGRNAEPRLREIATDPGANPEAQQLAAGALESLRVARQQEADWLAGAYWAGSAMPSDSTSRGIPPETR